MDLALYPRFVRMADGSKVLVQTATDHLALEGKQKPGESFDDLHGKKKAAEPEASDELEPDPYADAEEKPRKLGARKK